MDIYNVIVLKNGRMYKQFDSVEEILVSVGNYRGCGGKGEAVMHCSGGFLLDTIDSIDVYFDTISDRDLCATDNVSCESVRFYYN